MILVDSSAWIEYLRATGSPAHREVHRLIEAGATTCTTEVVMMEVLAGARSQAHLGSLRGLLLRGDIVPIHGLSDYEAAAAVYRACRAGGETVRRLTDCLIAAVAMRAGVSVLHADADFLVIARHTPLRVEPPPVEFPGTPQ